MDEADVKWALTRLLGDPVPGYSVAINALKIVAYKRDPSTAATIDRASLLSPDGFGAVLAFRWLHGRSVAKIDLPGCVLALADELGLSVFLLGTTAENNRLAEERVRLEYPGIRIAGRQHGFYDSLDAVAEAIKATEPRIVLIGMGSPKQERVAAELKGRLPNALYIGCGGRLDILAGKLSRAPEWYIRNNLEWLYRLLKQPKRIKQQAGLLIFLWMLISESIRARLLRQRR